MFETVTACGESCEGCRKKASGACPGCVGADGYVPEWAESGRCRVHACARSHGARYCFACPEFPCGDLSRMMPWKADAAERLTELKDRYDRENGI